MIVTSSSPKTPALENIVCNLRDYAINIVGLLNIGWREANHLYLLQRGIFVTPVKRTVHLKMVDAHSVYKDIFNMLEKHTEVYLVETPFGDWGVFNTEGDLMGFIHCQVIGSRSPWHRDSSYPGIISRQEPFGISVPETIEITCLANDFPDLIEFVDGLIAVHAEMDREFGNADHLRDCVVDLRPSSKLEEPAAINTILDLFRNEVNKSSSTIAMLGDGVYRVKCLTGEITFCKEEDLDAGVYVQVQDLCIKFTMLAQTICSMVARPAYHPEKQTLGTDYFEVSVSEDLKKFDCQRTTVCDTPS